MAAAGALAPKPAAWASRARRSSRFQQSHASWHSPRIGGLAASRGGLRFRGQLQRGRSGPAGRGESDAEGDERRRRVERCGAAPERQVKDAGPEIVRRACHDRDGRRRGRRSPDVFADGDGGGGVLPTVVVAGEASRRGGGLMLACRGCLLREAPGAAQQRGVLPHRQRQHDREHACAIHELPAGQRSKNRATGFGPKIRTIATQRGEVFSAGGPPGQILPIGVRCRSCEP